MEEKLFLLTEQQAQVFLLHQQGLTYEKIAGQLEIPINAVYRHIKAVYRKFREYDNYHDPNKRNDTPVDFPLTRGELKLVFSALRLLERDVLKKANSGRTKEDWKARLPYEAKILAGILERMQVEIYGKIIYNTLLK